MMRENIHRCQGFHQDQAKILTLNYSRRTYFFDYQYSFHYLLILILYYSYQITHPLISSYCYLKVITCVEWLQRWIIVQIPLVDLLWMFLILVCGGCHLWLSFTYYFLPLIFLPPLFHPRNLPLTHSWFCLLSLPSRLLYCLYSFWDVLCANIDKWFERIDLHNLLLGEENKVNSWVFYYFWWVLLRII